MLLAKVEFNERRKVERENADKFRVHSNQQGENTHNNHPRVKNSTDTEDLQRREKDRPQIHLNEANSSDFARENTISSFQSFVCHDEEQMIYDNLLETRPGPPTTAPTFSGSTAESKIDSLMEQNLLEIKRGKSRPGSSSGSTAAMEILASHLRLSTDRNSSYNPNSPSSKLLESGGKDKNKLLKLQKSKSGIELNKELKKKNAINLSSTSNLISEQTKSTSTNSKSMRNSVYVDPEGVLMPIVHKNNLLLPDVRNKETAKKATALSFEYRK